MQEHQSSKERELICINVDKVYDWIVKDLSFEHSQRIELRFPDFESVCAHNATTDSKPPTPVPIPLPPNTIYTCHVEPAEHNPVVIVSRENRNFTIDGRSVCLQQLVIQKNFKVTICIQLPDGTMHKSKSFKISRCEHVVMCAPKGTHVDVTYTDLDCFVCSTGMVTRVGDIVRFENLSLSITVCQSIQSTFPVTVEFLAEYCEPREELPFSSSSAARPRNCSVVFP